MKKFYLPLIFASFASNAMAGPDDAPPPPPATAPADAPRPAAQQEVADASAPPSQPAPSEVPQLPASPPAPPSEADAQNAGNAPPPGATPPPPSAAQPPPEAPPAQGQWVNTNQYGWIWVPYARNYTYVNPSGELAFTYAYYPTYGWQWIASPWVLGWGPTPYWGRPGPVYFAWHVRPWFARGVYRPTVWEHYNRSYYSRPVGPGRPAAPGPRAVYTHPAYHGGGGGGGWHGGGHHR